MTNYLSYLHTSLHSLFRLHSYKQFHTAKKSCTVTWAQAEMREYLLTLMIHVTAQHQVQTYASKHKACIFGFAVCIAKVACLQYCESNIQHSKHIVYRIQSDMYPLPISFHKLQTLLWEACNKIPKIP